MSSKIGGGGMGALEGAADEGVVASGGGGRKGRGLSGGGGGIHGSSNVWFVG